MDIFSFLAIALLTSLYTVSMYFMQKRLEKTTDKFIEKMSQPVNITPDWKDMVDHPENQIQDDDMLPLENLDEDTLKENITHMFTVQAGKDTEAEEAANKEVN